MRICRGVIPANPAEGPSEDIHCKQSPARFWSWNITLITMMILCVVMLMLIWSAGPPGGSASSPIPFP